MNDIKITNKGIYNTLKILVTGLLLFWFLKKVPISHYLKSEYLFSVSSGYVLLITFFWHFIQIHRWYHVLIISKPGVSWKKLAKSYFVGLFYQQLLPSSASGDVVRAIDAKKYLGSKDSFVSTFVIRLIGFFVALLFSWFFSVWDFTHFTNIYPSFIAMFSIESVFIVVGILMAVIWYKRISFFIPYFIKKRVVSYEVELQNYLTNKKRVLLIVIYGVALLVVTVIRYYMLAKTIDMPVPLFSLCATMPIIVFFASLPVSINGIGVRESITLLSFIPFGYERAEVLSLAVVSYATYYLSSFSGILWVLIDNTKERLKNGKEKKE